MSACMKKIGSPDLLILFTGTVSHKMIKCALNDIKGKKTVCLLSGGNIDVNILSRVITRGLVMAGRNSTLTIELEDKPGQLSGVSDIIPPLQGRANIFLKNGHNIIEVKIFSLFRNREPVNNGKYSAAAAGKKLKYSHSGIA